MKSRPRSGPTEDFLWRARTVEKLAAIARFAADRDNSSGNGAHLARCRVLITSPFGKTTVKLAEEFQRWDETSACRAR